MPCHPLQKGTPGDRRGPSPKRGDASCALLASSSKNTRREPGPPSPSGPPSSSGPPAGTLPKTKTIKHVLQNNLRSQIKGDKHQRRTKHLGQKTSGQKTTGVCHNSVGGRKRPTLLRQTTAYAAFRVECCSVVFWCEWFLSLVFTVLVFWEVLVWSAGSARVCSPSSSYSASCLPPSRISFAMCACLHPLPHPGDHQATPAEGNILTQFGPLIFG